MSFSDAPYGSFWDLPYEAGDPDPQPLEYDDLPDRKFKPGQDWRVAQMKHAQNHYGEFAPEQHGEFAPKHQEATDG